MPPLAEQATLYSLDIKVRPLPGHPLYWECQCGILRIWLYGNSPEDAARRLELIMAALPYDRVGSEAVVSEASGDNSSAQADSTDGPSVLMREQCAIREQLARQTGLSMLLIAVAVGGDDAGFETTPLG